MRLWDRYSCFFQSRFKILFDCLLDVKTNYVPQRFLPSTVKGCRSEKIFLRFDCPFTRACLHTSFDRNARH